MKQQIPHQRYLELAEKWVNGTITPEEEREYAQWFNDFPEDAGLDVPPELATSREAHRQLLLRRINQVRRPAIPLYLRPVRRLAAAAILLLLAGGVWWYSRKPSSAGATTSPAIVKNDIPPGANGAILVLAGGRTILLDTAGNGVLATAGGAPVIKSSGSLAFGDRSGSSYPAGSDPLAYNTLTTPRARQQHVVLSDGTGVWLNAGSSIRFPTRFPKDSREVEVTGEAYFEVANDPARPFHVDIPARIAGGQPSVIEILGTHFNVMAYANEGQLRTTLLEGSVRFRGGTKSLLLKPGQQGILSAHNELKLLADADTSQAIAWKNGIQAFDSADLPTIMRQIERWYDVEVEYNGAIPSRTFTGNIPRSASLAQLLQLFQVVGIHFIIDAEKKKLIIMP
jgi:ferric-dicitrate binding protein FerR (iron transport regulator)